MNKEKPVSMQDLPRIAWQRILQEFQTRTAPSRPRAIKVGSSIQEIASQIRTRQSPRFFGLIVEQAALLTRFFPDVFSLTLRQADAIKEHHFNLDGTEDLDLGKDINWHSDIKSKVIWPLDPVSRLKIKVDDPGDPHLPWMLSRFYHTVRLGQAYLLTEDESYAREIVDQVESWIRVNPNGFGINWADQTTVAVRLINWIWTYYFILESKSLTDKFLALWLASLKAHAQYLARISDDKWPHSTSWVAVAAALAYAGILLPEFPDSSRWKTIGTARIWETLEREVNVDGFYYAGSMARHRFVTELALSVSALCVVNNIEIPETAQSRMRAMLDVIMTSTKSDGTTAQIGSPSADRILRLSVYDEAKREVVDYRYLLSLGSLVLERQLSEWAGFIEPTSRGWSIAAEDQWQDAFWYFASDAAARLTDVITRTTARPENVSPDNWVDVRAGIRVRARALAHKPVATNDVVSSHGFEASGLYVMRNDDFLMLVEAGTGRIEGKGHTPGADLFAVVMSAYGRDFLVEAETEGDDHPQVSGSLLSSRNVLCVGSAAGKPGTNREKSVHRNPRITVHHWRSEPGYDLFDASHDGNERAVKGLTHRRQIWLDKTARLWVIHDQLKMVTADQIGASDEFDVAIWMHFGALPVRVDKANNAVRIEADKGANLIILPLGDFRLEPHVEKDSYSAPARSTQNSTAVCFSGKSKLPADFILLLYPYHTDIDLKLVRAAGRTALINFRKAFEPMTPTSKVSARSARPARSIKKS